MPTKRKRKTHARRPEISQTALFYASDGFWGQQEGSSNFQNLDFKFPAAHPEQARAVWSSIRAEFVPEWIKAHPGTRPQWWYLFDPDCPRVSSQDAKRQGWEGCYFLDLIPDLRRRLGGIGDPDFEHWSIVPTFRCAVPDRFVTDLDEDDEDFHGKLFDPDDPPIYESQAAYLKRHGLLIAAEKRSLKPKDFQPEIINLETQEEEKGKQHR